MVIKRNSKFDIKFSKIYLIVIIFFVFENFGIYILNHSWFYYNYYYYYKILIISYFNKRYSINKTKIII